MILSLLTYVLECVESFVIGRLDLSISEYQMSGTHDV